jgi:hypothetical protein
MALICHTVAIVLVSIPTAAESILDPRDWPSGVYFALIATLLLLRLLVSWPESGFLHFVEELCLILPLGLFYFFVRGLSRADASVAIAHAERVISIERSLGIFIEPRLQHAVLKRVALVDLANWVYVWCHWPVILLWVIWMWVRHRAVYPIYRNAILLSGGAGMLVFAFYPVAPPRLVPDLGLVDTITLRSHSYRALQPPALTDLYASMPSLHFGWDLIVGIAIARNAATNAGPLLGALLPCAMFSAIVLTANHYVLDGVVGGVFALTGLAVSTYVTPRWSPVLGHLKVWSRIRSAQSRVGERT